MISLLFVVMSLHYTRVAKGRWDSLVRCQDLGWTWMLGKRFRNRSEPQR